MCGILGNFGFVERDVFKDHINISSDQLDRRGPNQKNIIDIDNFFAAHSRLIVQGTSGDGIQPMSFKNLYLLFNGNLYNKNTLKKELESHGYEFDGVSDTEIVIKSLHHWDTKAFEKFNGFFAIALFNKLTKTLVLARDRLGEKPMYYSNNNRSVFFGSTENLIPNKYSGKLRQESLVDFITFGFIPSPNTMLENLFSIDPGSFIKFSFTSNKIIQDATTNYWQPEITNEIDDFDDSIELISSMLDDSINEGMDASIDVACLLSGGVDSSLILLNARKINENICGITADFGINDDAHFRSVSLVDALNHKNHLIKNISSNDVDHSLNSVHKICESPFDDTSIIPSNVVFTTVKNSGYSVALTGDGADELFCGYSSFGNLKKIERYLNPKFDTLRYPMRYLSNLVPNSINNNFHRLFMFEDELLQDLLCNGFKKKEWNNVIDTNYDPLHHLDKIIQELDGLSPLDKLRILNLKFKLPYQMLYKVDRASMYNSVEARPFFLNNKVVDAALKITSSAMMRNGQKSILKEIYKSQINHSGWNLPKSGFGWKTDSYADIFGHSDNVFLKSKTSIDGLQLLKNRRRHHKRGYYGLFSLVSWLNNNT